MNKSGFDSEYASLMAELGESGKGLGGDASKGPWGAGGGGHGPLPRAPTRPYRPLAHVCSG